VVDLAALMLVLEMVDMLMEPRLDIVNHQMLQIMR
jgi:hypothetical protein